jgi:PQQ-like domain
MLVVVALPGAVARADTSSAGTPPPEWAANAGSWPSHNADLANTRADLRTRIDAGDVATLQKRWTFDLPTETVIGAGKSGYVVAFRASDGKRLWSLPIGRHNRYQPGPLPTKPVAFCPGSLGGVLTPMAEARGVLYVPWIDLCFRGSATSLGGAAGKPGGGLAAIDATTGAVLWRHRFTTIDAGAATVADDVVVTSTYDGSIYALSTTTGATLWRTKAPAGINSFPAVTRTMLIIGAGARTSATRAPSGRIVAYSLPGA